MVMKRPLGLGWLAAVTAARTGAQRLLGRGWPAGSGSSARRRPVRDRASGPKPAVLVVSPYSIYPTIHGGAVRIFNLVRRLSDQFEISLLIFGGGTDDPPQRAELERFCRRVLFQRLPEPDPALDPWGRLPPSAARYASPEVADRVAALIQAHQIDVVMLEYTEMGQFAGPYPGARSVLVEHDLSFRSHARQRSVGIHRRSGAAETLGRGVGDWLRRYHFELSCCGRVDQIHVMSVADRDLLAPRIAGGAGRIRVIPNGVDTSHFHPPAGDTPRRGALFVGSFPHLPNQDACEHLVSDIWPLIRQRLPDVRLTVAGARPPRWVLDLDGHDGIEVAGEVADLAPLYRRHRVLLVPIRAGSGTRLKILEAMACGLPIVSTTIGAEGIVGRPGTDLLIADDAARFAEVAAGLLEDSAGTRRAELAACGRALVTESYDWDRIADQLRASLAELAPVARREARCGGAEPNGAPPFATVVIPVSGRGPTLRACLEGVSRQRLDDGFEVLCVGDGVSSADRALIERHGARLIATGGGEPRIQLSINAGATAARGRVLALIGEDAVPADDEWLSRLVEPFRAAAPPAAVQGGLHAQFVAGGPPHDPFFTAETRRWRERMGGFALSLVNAAFRRDVWERFPPPPAAGLVDRRWQRELIANGELILPCWAAAVHWVRPLQLSDAACAGWREGRSWRELGVRYRLGDLVSDLRHGSSPPGSGSGESSSVPPGALTRAHRLYGAVRPLALFLGNRLWLGGPGYNAAGAAQPRATTDLRRPELTE
jgi:glycosyltransferase involved in cell wall biosynthesis